MLREIRNPDLYHGSRKKGYFFEGWYFKLADKDGRHVFAFIPGIYKDKDRSMSHSFIQVLNGAEVNYRYIRYEEEAFKWEKHSFEIAVSQSMFSAGGMNLDIESEGLAVKGTVSFSNLVRWRDSLINPGSMGFYNYFTFMECYSQVCAITGSVSGKLIVNDEEICFDGGKVYIEKNWGRSFPQYWIWVQCNSFCNAGAALTCSAGRVPFLRGSFDGFLVALAAEGVFYSFTSINKSTLYIEEKNEDVKLFLANRKYTLGIETESRKDSYVTCMGPNGQGMLPLVDECLTGRVQVELRKAQNGDIIFKDSGVCTGIEYGGKRMFKN